MYDNEFAKYGDNIYNKLWCLCLIFLCFKKNIILAHKVFVFFTAISLTFKHGESVDIWDILQFSLSKINFFSIYILYNKNKSSSLRKKNVVKMFTVI